MSLNVEVLEKVLGALSFKQTILLSVSIKTCSLDYPQLRPLFAKTNMEEQQQKLMMSLVLVIENLRNPIT